MSFLKMHSRVNQPTSGSFRTSQYSYFRQFIMVLIICSISSMGYGQKKYGKWHHPNKKENIILFACIEDLGNDKYRVNFGYDNPNSTEVVVRRKASRVVFKKKGKKGKYYYSKKKSFYALNRFQPGIVEKAFSVDITESELLEWSVKNPYSKKSKVKANSDSPICVEPSVIIPVYGQEFGKSETKIGLELTALAEDNAGDLPSNIVYQINADGEVLLEIVPTMGREQEVINILTGTYGRVFSTDAMSTDFVVDPALVISENLATIDVFFPIANLLELNDIEAINFTRPLYTPIKLQGIVTSQGDTAMLTDIVRESYVLDREEDGTPIKVDGSGVKIGVISDSFDKQPFTGISKATVDVGNGDLPGVDNPNGYSSPVDVLKDYPYGVASDEGRAMLHLIHDVAPGAELAFSTGVLSPRDFALAIQDLAAVGCNIITDDITYPFEPFFGEGQVTDAIRAFTSGEGNLYFTSAGNFSNKGYQSQFMASSVPPETNIPSLVDASAHVFGMNPDGSEDVLQRIEVVPGTYMIVLQWAEGLASQDNSTGATTDLDIFLVDDNGNLIVGNNRKNEMGDAAEVLVFQATGDGIANILITRTNAPGTPSGPLPMRYIAFRTSSDAGTADGLKFIEYNQGAPTVSGHAMTPEAITVGAVDFRVAQNPSSQSFSSYAGILANNQILEVDISAPDGGNTNVESVGQDIDFDEDNFPNFFGTSAAAPHAAATFALALSTLPSWYPEGLPIEIETVSTNLVADQLLQLFKNTAVPSGALETAGIGLINANEAFKQLAEQTAIITSLTVEEGKTPSLEPFEVTISGKYFPENPVVLFDDMELVIVEGNTDTEIKAIVGPFSNNPELTVFTNADIGGGESNSLKFFSDGKIAINIIADDIDIEFGQSFNFIFQLDGLPEPYTDGIPEDKTLAEVLEELGLPALPEILFTSPAVLPYPDVNNYIIAPGFGEEVLTQEQLDAYQVNFINGQLTVNKKDLTISPENESIVYGEAVNVILNYEYNTDGIEENNDFLQTIVNAHSSDFFDDNTLILINKFRAVINEQDILDLLNNGELGSSWMASERIYDPTNNKFRAVINGEMNLIDLEVENFDNYFAIEPIDNKFRAVINKFRAVINGENLLNNQIELLNPETNKFRAVINGTGILNENGFQAYDKVFAVVDFEDGTPEGEEPRTVDKLYATNLLTGLDVTAGETPSLIYPGAFLSAYANNFIIKYGSADITVTPTPLFVQTPNLAIDYGVGITTEFINSRISPASLVFDGLVYNETGSTVFADPDCIAEELPESETCPIVIPYYFEDVDTLDQYFIDDTDEAGLSLPAGSYFIKINNPQNYILDFGEAIGILTVSNKELTVSGNNDGEPYEIVYGETVSSVVLDALVIISGLDEEEIGNVFPDGIIPYFLEEKLENPEEEANTFELGDPISAGDYYVRINMPESNYEIIYDDPLIVRVNKKELTFNADSFESEYGVAITGEDIRKFDNPSESNVEVLQGFAYEDDESDLFDEVIPYVFVAFEDEGETEIPLDGRLSVRFYNIRIDSGVVEELQNYTIFYEDEGEEEENNSLEITKATLNVCIDDVEIRDGERLFPDDIVSQITGYVFDDTRENVFPGGILTYLVELDNKDLLEVTEDGLLLGEGTYTIKIKDDELVNYLVQDGETCSGEGTVEVTQCGDATLLDFSNYTQQGTVYRFTNVAPGSDLNLDALVTIQTLVNVQSFTVDQNNFPAGSDDRKQFRPLASFNITTTVPEPYLEFRIELVNAGTNTLANNVTNLIAGVLDIDGQTNFQEYVEVSLPLEYTVDGATQIQAIEDTDQGLLRVNGYNDSYTDAFNGAPRVNVEVVYESVSSLIYRVGTKTNGTGHVNVPTRQYGIQFSCLDNFTNPQTTEAIFGGAFTSSTAPNNEGVVFPNPFRDILYLQPEVTAAGTIEVLDMTGNARIAFSIDQETPQPIEIDMSTLPGNAYYFVRITTNGLSEVYTVFKE